MHDKIRACWNLAASQHAQASTSRQTQENFLNKFAELIINECVDAIPDPEGQRHRDLIRKKFGQDA